MGIKFTADNVGTDVTFGGGTDATNWSKTFSDYHQTATTNQYYPMSGSQSGASLHMPYQYSITVLPRTDPGTGSYDSDGGNRYYPVSFSSGSVRRASAMPNLVIMRNYHSPGPYQFEVNNSVDIGWTGSSSHQGGLYASFHVGDSAWSDMYEAQITRLRLTYHQTIGGFAMRLAHNTDRGAGPFYILLRGGFTYTVASSYPSMPTQVTAGGSVFSHGGNNSYQQWPVSTTSPDTTYGSSITTMG